LINSVLEGVVTDKSPKVGDEVFVPGLVSIRMLFESVDSTSGFAKCTYEEDGFKKHKLVRIDALKKAPRQATKKIKQ